MSDPHDYGFETKAIHAGQPADPATGAVMTPIYATSTYKQDGVGGLRSGYEYSRTANPTRSAFERCFAALEFGERARRLRFGHGGRRCAGTGHVFARRPCRHTQRCLRRHVSVVRHGLQAVGSGLHVGVHP